MTGTGDKNTARTRLNRNKLIISMELRWWLLLVLGMLLRHQFIHSLWVPERVEPSHPTIHPTSLLSSSLAPPSFRNFISLPCLYSLIILRLVCVLWTRRIAFVLVHHQVMVTASAVVGSVLAGCAVGLAWHTRFVVVI